ncbi:MAG: hypothetical protein WAK96_08830, partial [Desulfobaccales bacterium]
DSGTGCSIRSNGPFDPRQNKHLKGGLIFTRLGFPPSLLTGLDVHNFIAAPGATISNQVPRPQLLSGIKLFHYTLPPQKPKIKRQTLQPAFIPQSKNRNRISRMTRLTRHIGGA